MKTLATMAAILGLTLLVAVTFGWIWLSIIAGWGLAFLVFGAVAGLPNFISAQVRKDQERLGPVSPDEHAARHASPMSPEEYRKTWGAGSD